jgi:hypothetical protein
MRSTINIFSAPYCKHMCESTQNSLHQAIIMSRLMKNQSPTKHSAARHLAHDRQQTGNSSSSSLVSCAPGFNSLLLQRNRHNLRTRA